LQGNAAQADEARAEGQRRSRCPRRPRPRRAPGQHRRGQRGQGQPAAAGEADRNLREGRAANPRQAVSRTRTGSRASPASRHERDADDLRAMTDSPEHPQANPWFVAIAVMFATFMEVLDTTVVNVSLPHSAGNLSATIDEATCALTLYRVRDGLI